MKPDPSQRRPPPEGALTAAVRTGKRRRASRLVVAALVVLSVAVASALTLPRGLRDDQLAGAAAPTIGDCPALRALIGAKDDPPVPSPARGFDGNASLVPQDEVPEAVLLCAYRLLDRPDGALLPSDRQALETSRVVEAGLASLPKDLSLPRHAETVGCGFGRDYSSRPGYLVHVLYAEKSVWLEVGSLCGQVTNGEFSGDADVSPLLQAALENGVWGGSPD